jgi:uncharacterized membrane protein
MAANDLTLVAGTYDDAGTAVSDSDSLKRGQDAGGYTIHGLVVLTRDAKGDVRLQEHDASVGHGATIGAGAGIVIGLFAPPMLVATLVGAAVGAGIGKLRKRHEEKKLGVDVDEYLPPGTTAVVAVVTAESADKAEAALVRADKRVSRPVAPEDYEALKDLMSESSRNDTDVTADD